ncbi:Luciferase, partial [Operophtera brumata]
KLGLVPGDVLALGGNNHINLHIPYYAAILNGLPIAGVYYEEVRKKERKKKEMKFILTKTMRLRKDTLLMEAYGQTENLGPEYYNNPEETAKAFTADGWYKTGDLLYHDENYNYFFVERLKMLIKYRSYHIVPPELEEVIRSHSGVHEVSVTSIPHDVDGEHAVACVVRRLGSAVSAQDIKDLVAEKLSETKQLRGGVVFMDALPMTSAGKVARAKLREIVKTAFRE